MISGMDAAALLFDLDGVVVDNMRWHERAWGEFLAARGVRMDVGEFLRKTSGMPTRDVLAHYYGRPVTGAELEACSREKESLYRRLYAPELKAAPGFASLIEEGRRLGLKTGLGTGSMPENVDFVLDGLGLRPSFDAVVGAADVRNGKPHPETFLTLAARLAVPPSRCVVFEDSLLGEKAARAAGMAVVAVTTSHAASEFAGPDLAVHDFEGLTVPRLLSLVP